MRNLRYSKRISLTAAAAAATALLLGLGTVPALADSPTSTFPIGWAPIGIYPRSNTVWSSSHSGAAIPNGTPVEVVCEAEGQAVSSSAGTSVIWDRLASPANAWIPNVFLATGYAAWTPGVPRCSDYDASIAQEQRDALSTSEGQYDRAGAAEWARTNAIGFTHRYGDNCTWFVSNALWQGGALPKSAEWTDSSRDIGNLASRWDVFLSGPTKDATVAARLRDYLTSTGLATSSSTELNLADPIVPGAKLGDLIAYDWDPDDTADGTVDHAMIITGFDAQGSPLVSGQTNDVVDQQWQHTHDGQLIVDTKKVVRAYLVHITY